jgi:hypothetical protein
VDVLADITLTLEPKLGPQLLSLLLSLISQIVKQEPIKIIYPSTMTAKEMQPIKTLYPSTMTAKEIRKNTIFPKASVCKKRRNDFNLREGDNSLQSMNTRRRYMRRGSRAPNMFGNSVSTCRQEEILALAQQTAIEIEFNDLFKNSKRKKMSPMDDLNQSLSSLSTYDSTDHPVE